eukprot:gene420-585_t
MTVVVFLILVGLVPFVFSMNQWTDCVGELENRDLGSKGVLIDFEKSWGSQEYKPRNTKVRSNDGSQVYGSQVYGARVFKPSTRGSQEYKSRTKTSLLDDVNPISPRQNDNKDVNVSPKNKQVVNVVPKDEAMSGKARMLQKKLSQLDAGTSANIMADLNGGCNRDSGRKFCGKAEFGSPSKKRPNQSMLLLLRRAVRFGAGHRQVPAHVLHEFGSAFERGASPKDVASSFRPAFIVFGSESCSGYRHVRRKFWVGVGWCVAWASVSPTKPGYLIEHSTDWAKPLRYWGRTRDEGLENFISTTAPWANFAVDFAGPPAMPWAVVPAPCCAFCMVTAAATSTAASGTAKVGFGGLKPAPLMIREAMAPRSECLSEFCMCLPMRLPARIAELRMLDQHIQLRRHGRRPTIGTFRKAIPDRGVLHWVDNMAALCALTKGYWITPADAATLRGKFQFLSLGMLDGPQVKGFQLLKWAFRMGPSKALAPNSKAYQQKPPASFLELSFSFFHLVAKVNKEPFQSTLVRELVLNWGEWFLPNARPPATMVTIIVEDEKWADNAEYWFKEQPELGIVIEIPHDYQELWRIHGTRVVRVNGHEVETFTDLESIEDHWNQNRTELVIQDIPRINIHMRRNPNGRKGSSVIGDGSGRFGSFIGSSARRRSSAQVRMSSRRTSNPSSRRRRSSGLSWFSAKNNEEATGHLVAMNSDNFVIAMPNHVPTGHRFQLYSNPPTQEQHRTVRKKKKTLRNFL